MAQTREARRARRATGSGNAVCLAANSSENSRNRGCRCELGTARGGHARRSARPRQSDIGSPSRKQTKARNTRPMPPKKHCAAKCQNFVDIPQLTRLLSIRMLPLATLTMRIVGKPRDREIIPRGCSVFATIGTASLNFPPSARSTVVMLSNTVRSTASPWRRSQTSIQLHHTPLRSDSRAARARRPRALCASRV